MKIKQEYIDSTPEEIWGLLIEYIKKEKKFYSTGNNPIEYDAKIINNGSQIHFIGGDGEERGTIGHSIYKCDFIPAYKIAKGLPYINTSTTKACKPIYSMRSPFVGLLHTAGIIE